ncbi:hypothetical protein SNK04_014032 [Fusarium graminearum]
MLGFKIPASFGTTLLQRVGSGAAANLAVGTATASAQQAVLESSGNAELAKAYSPSTLRHERSTGYRSWPARDEASSAAHQNALASAMRSVLRGEPVSVAESIQAAEFLPFTRAGVPSEMAANYDLGPARYEAYRRALESGFRADATNASSSATGIDQFTAGTWRSIVAQAKPSWARV